MRAYKLPLLVFIDIDKIQYNRSKGCCFDENKFKLIINSIKKYGYLDEWPITCYKDKRKYVLLDGFYRIEAMKQLGKLEIYAAVNQKHILKRKVLKEINYDK